jgi:RimJ/RimL family protein N-acetyltransferase
VISESILQGQGVRLRPVQEADLPLFVEWLNQTEVRYWLSLSEAPQLTLEGEREWYEERRASEADLLWTIETEQGLPIGNIDLHLLDRTHGRAQLGIVIGDAEAQGQGYGTAAIREVLRYAFGEMGLRRVELLVDEDNARAIRCYERCGFVREGVLRHYRLRRRRPVNALIMAVLRRDWKKSNGRIR